MSNAAKPTLPEDFYLVYEGQPLLPFYAAEMLQPYIGKTIWVADAGGRTRCGQLTSIPRVSENATDCDSPVEFEDERPLFLRQIVCIAYYKPQR